MLTRVLADRERVRDTVGRMTVPDNHRLKVDWARRHLETLEREIWVWIDKTRRATLTSIEFDPPSFVVTLDPGEVPCDFALTAGDVLQTTRAALEHLAYELALTYAGRLSAKDERDTGFPVVGDQNGGGATLWADQASRKLRAVSTAAVQAIDQLQPYKLGPSWADNPLWVLNELARVDRHRLLHLVVATVGGIEFNQPPPELPRDDWPGASYYGGRLDGLTELARIPSPVRLDHVTEVSQSARAQLELVFDDDVPLVAGQPVLLTLRRVLDHVDYAVVPALRKHL